MPPYLDLESLPLFSQTLASGDLRGYMYPRPAPEDAMASFSKYMSQYDHEHTNPWNKLMHGHRNSHHHRGYSPRRLHLLAPRPRPIRRWMDSPLRRPPHRRQQARVFSRCDLLSRRPDLDRQRTQRHPARLVTQIPRHALTSTQRRRRSINLAQGGSLGNKNGAKRHRLSDFRLGI
jgi:hypothetical protein